MKVKKLMAMMLCIVMLASLFAGCGGGEPEAESTEAAEWDGKITIGVVDHPLVQDYETNKLTLWLEEQTGYDLEFQVLAASNGDAKSQLATRTAGGEKLPDIIIGLSLSDGEIKDYGDDGYFLDLKEILYDREKSNNFWELLEHAYPDDEERAFLMQRATDPENGAIYALPSMEYSIFDPIDSMVYINTAWLDKLGLEMPTDNDSLYEVLKAFVNDDPNGNGLRDEIGIVGRPYGTFGHSATSWLINNFCLMSTEEWFNVDDNGKLSLPFMSDEYREALIYLNKLTRENLLPSSIWSMTPADTKRLLNPDDGVNRVGIFVGHPSVVLNEGYTNHYEYEPLPYWGYAMEHSQSFVKRVFITEDCDNLDAVWNLLMTMHTQEAVYRMRYGEYGVDWEYADDNTTSVSGEEAKIKVLNMDVWSTSNNQNWHSTVGTITFYSENENTQLDEDMSEWAKFKYGLLMGAYRNKEAALKAKPYKKMMPLIYTEEERLLTEAEVSNCKAWIETMRAQFACGTDGLDPANDKDWQDYLDELNRLGVDTWIEQAQNIYDRQVEQLIIQ